MRAAESRIVILCLVAIGTVATASAEGQTIRILPIGTADPTKSEYIAAECLGDTGQQRMSCDFMQVALWLKTRPEDATAKIDQQLRETTAADLKEFPRSDVCRPSELKKLTDNTPQAPAGVRSYLSRMVESLKTACQTPTRDNLAGFFKSTLDIETHTCQIWVSRWQADFVRQGDLKWISNEGPDGICGTINIVTLERLRDNELWTYSGRRLITNIEASPLCKDFSETQSEFSWRYSTKPLACDLVEAGALQVK